MWLKTFPEGLIIRGNANSVSRSKLWLFVFSEWFTVKYWHKVRVLEVVGFHVHATIVSRIHCCKQVRQFMIILVPIILQLAIQYVFEWGYCTFYKCCFRLTHCRVKFYSFSAANSLELSSKFWPLIYRKFLWCILCGNHFWKCLDCFLPVFCFHYLCIYGSV